MFIEQVLWLCFVHLIVSARRNQGRQGQDPTAQGARNYFLEIFFWWMQLSPVAAVEAQVQALQFNDLPRSDHGIEV